LHPERLFDEFLRLVGELATFATPERRARDYPVYDQDDLENVFGPVMRDLQDFLSARLGRRAIRLEIIERAHNAFMSTIRDRTLFRNATFVLEVAARRPLTEIQSHFPHLFKVGPNTKMNEIVHAHLPGVPLIHLPTPPPQIRAITDHVYFFFDRKSPLRPEFSAASSIGMHFSGDWPELELDLWAILEARRSTTRSHHAIRSALLVRGASSDPSWAAGHRPDSGRPAPGRAGRSGRRAPGALRSRASRVWPAAAGGACGHTLCAAGYAWKSQSRRMDHSAGPGAAAAHPPGPRPRGEDRRARRAQRKSDPALRRPVVASARPPACRAGTRLVREPDGASRRRHQIFRAGNSLRRHLGSAGEFRQIYHLRDRRRYRPEHPDRGPPRLDAIQHAEPFLRRAHRRRALL